MDVCLLWNDYIPRLRELREVSINDVTQEEEQIRLKRQLTQNIAHELETPVNSIQGYLETIVNNENISREKRQPFLERCYAQSSVSHCHATLRINTYGRSCKHDRHGENRHQPVGRQHRKRGIPGTGRKAYHRSQPLKPKIQLRGGIPLLYSIFRNLMDNAIAYPGTDIRINISCFREDENFYYFRFADTGVGVFPEHLNRLFERFYR